MTHVKIPEALLEGVLYALQQVKYSGEWYEFASSHRHPDPVLPTTPPANYPPQFFDHLQKLKDIRQAEALILRKMAAETPTGFVYLIGQADPEDDATIAAVKVGFSKDPWRRLQQLKTASPRRLYIIGSLPGRTSEHERELHRQLDPHRMNGEWFQWSPRVKALLADAGFTFQFPVTP